MDYDNNNSCFNHRQFTHDYIAMHNMDSRHVNECIANQKRDYSVNQNVNETLALDIVKNGVKYYV